MISLPEGREPGRAVGGACGARIKFSARMVPSTRCRRRHGPIVAAGADVTVATVARAFAGVTVGTIFGCRRHLHKGHGDINKCDELASQCRRMAGHDEREQWAQQSDSIYTLAACARTATCASIISMRARSTQALK